MAQARSTLAFLLLLLWMASPALRCLVPGEVLTAQEQACCKSMGGQCGDAPASDHPCCKRVTSSAQPAMVSVQFSTHPTFAVVPALAMSIPPAIEREFAGNRLIDPSPPSQDPHFSPILRI